MRFVNACHFGRLHFEQGHEERKRGFSSLVFVYTIRMKAVSAAAGYCIVQRHLQIVLAEKPTKDPLASSSHWRSSVNLYTSRQAETVAQASTGC